MRYLMLGLLLSPCLSTLAGEHTDRQTENLQAFAKLYGLVRYFHPSDEAQTIDWDRFAVYGAEQVLNAQTDKELKASLDDLFSPLAPTLVIYQTGTEAPDPAQPLPEDRTHLKQVSWRHLGLGMSGRNVYRSVRSNREDPSPVDSHSFGNVMRSVPVDALKGKQVRFTIRARQAGGGKIQGWLRVDRPNGNRGLFDNMMDRPLTGTSWQEETIEGLVHEDADKVFIGAMMFGDGEAHVDAMTLEVQEADGTWKPVSVSNHDFTNEKTYTDWMTRGGGFGFSSGEDSGKMFAKIFRTKNGSSWPAPFEELPAEDASVDQPINATLSAKMLVSLYSLDNQTLGHGDKKSLEELQNALEAMPKAEQLSAKDVATRLGAVVINWNIFQHFYPYWDVVKTDWNSVLDKSLADALNEHDAASFQDTLNWMVAQLKDGHGRVGHSVLQGKKASIAVAVRWVEDKAVVLRSEDERFKMGDIIVSIDDEPVDDLIARKEKLISGSPQWVRFRSMGGLFRGPEDSSVRVVVLRGKEYVDIEAKRNFKEYRMRARDRESIGPLQDGIYYVDLDVASMDDIRKQIDSLAEAKGVVFDLRGYPNGNHQILGHLTDQPVKSPAWKLPKYTMPNQADLSWLERGWPVANAEPKFKGRAVFLTNGSAISYAETFMSMVDHFKLGAIVGSPTAGANGNVNPFVLPGNYRVSWTGMRVNRHDEGQHHIVGVPPTHPLERTIDGVLAGRDEYIDKAIELIETGW